MSPMNTVLRLAPLAASLSAAVSSYAHSPPQFSAARSLASDKCTCTLVPQGHGQDDAPAIASILSLCGQNGSTVCFPDPYVYTIGSALETYVDNATILLEGTFQFSPNITYWANNSFAIELQNQISAWRFHGRNFVLDGGESFTGRIDGNGQIWYTYSAGGSNTPGRPMTLDVYGSSNGILRNLQIYQPQFWALIIEGSENILVENVEVFAENTEYAANGTNWVQNTDGADTWRSTNITFNNFTYTGGDDCIAFKGNSTTIRLANITCNGGPGIAFGSIGQYVDAPDFLTDIIIDGAQINKPTYSGVGLGQGIGAGVYFKSWIGAPVGTPPNGGGGGGGAVTNVTVSNINVDDVDLAFYINSCLSYITTIDPTANPDKYCNTSTLAYNNISFNNFQGTTNGDYGGVVAQLNCSTAAPCNGFTFTDFNVVPTGTNGTGQSAIFTCQNVDSIDGETCS